MGQMESALAVLAVGIVAAVVWILAYNRLIALWHEVEAARGALVAQLRQRHDLIPDVLAVAREAVRVQMEELNRIFSGIGKHIGGTPAPPSPDASLSHEENVLRMAEAAHRTRPLPHPPVGRLDPSVYVELQRALRATEENVAAARRFLEAAIGQYNAATGSFLGSIVARWHGLRPVERSVVTQVLERKPDYFLAAASAS
jgi:LemA protein